MSAAVPNPGAKHGEGPITTRMHRLARIFVVSALATIGAASITEGAREAAAQPTQASQAKPMKIRIVVQGATVVGTLDDHPTARDFASLLPLSLTLTDYARTEKVGDLPRSLTTDGAPPGHDPSAGVIAYYAPWGNLAIFYRDFGYSEGLIKLGMIGSGGAALGRSGAMQATIELVGDEGNRGVTPHPR